MKRVAFYLFYDEQGVVDDYVSYKLKALREHVEHIFVVSNSPLTFDGRKKLEQVADTVFCRENVGFDVWGYKEAMEAFGFERLKEYDEAILLNYTFFGPIFPFSELFSKMSAKGVDFWGISDHAEMSPNPFTGHGVLPNHIQSHFIAVGKRLLSSLEFAEYWQKMPMIESYTSSILQHESRFTKHFSDKGFSHAVYCEEKNYESDYPTLLQAPQTFEERCPILKRRLFFNDPLVSDYNSVIPLKAFDFVKQYTDYPVDLIWQNVLRTVPPKILATSLGLLKTFDERSNVSELNNTSQFSGRIAVVAHVFYAEMIEEIMGYIHHIKPRFDLFITTASEDSKAELERYFANIGEKNYSVEIRIVEKNRGRDIGALLITCKDIHDDGRYDLICRLHSKKSPQVAYTAGERFKKHMYENLLSSESYVEQVLQFMSQPRVGFLMPTMLHVGYSTLGHAWFSNKDLAQELAKKIGIQTPFDDVSPHAAYGTMFWYKPAALKKLVEYDWKWSDFNAEASDDKKSKGHTDGSVAHVIERLLAYCAHDAGYAAYCISTAENMRTDHLNLEYKMNRIMTNLSNGDVLYQTSYLASTNGGSMHKALAQVVHILKLRVGNKAPWVKRILKYPYRALKLTYKKVFIRQKYK